MATEDTLFEGLDITQYTPAELMAAHTLYNYITESASIAEQENVPLGDVLDEGVFGAILGGVAGATVGPAIGKAICKVLGIDEKGLLGSLITSRLCLAALGTELGYRL